MTYDTRPLRRLSGDLSQHIHFLGDERITTAAADEIERLSGLVIEMERLHTRIGPAAVAALLDGKTAVVPVEATIENGMQAKLSGEFSLSYTVREEDEEGEEEEVAYGLMVPWPLIKDIIKQFVDKSRLDTAPLEGE